MAAEQDVAELEPAAPWSMSWLATWLCASFPDSAFSHVDASESARAVIFTPQESANARNLGASHPPRQLVVKCLPAHHGAGLGLPSSQAFAPGIMGEGVGASPLLTPAGSE